MSPFIYKPVGKSVDLPYEAEEVAGFYAALLESDHAKDTTFNNNFFEDWKTLMKKHPPVCCVVSQSKHDIQCFSSETVQRLRPLIFAISALCSSISRVRKPRKKP